MTNTVIRLGYISVSGGGGAGFEEYPNLAGFPPVGQSDVIYVALDTNKTYRWSGSTYVEISPSEVVSVNTKVGVVVLDKTDIGLGNVDNTSDADKPISSATQDALDLKYDASNPAGYITLGEVPADLVTSVNGQVGDVVLDKGDVGLDQVDNTSDADKPISNDTQDALDLKVDLAGDTLTGTLDWNYDNSFGSVSDTGNTSIQGIGFNSSYTYSEPGFDQGGTTSVDGFGLTNSSFEQTEQRSTSLAYTGFYHRRVITGPLGTTYEAIMPTQDYQMTPKEYVDNLNNGLIDSLKYNQVIYVDKANTNTYTPDGSINKPYKSIEAMYNAITDASASKRYACIIAPGTYTESNTMQIKGWIDLTSVVTDTVIISISGGATLKWSNNSPGRVFIKDIGFTSGLEVLNDNPTGTSGLVFDLDNVDAPSLIFRGRGGGVDFIQLRNDTRISGTCTIQSASTTIFDSTNISTLIMNDVGCLIPDGFGSAITASIRSNYIGAISITATTYDVYTDIWGSIIAGNLTIVSNSPSYPCYFNYDATSYPQGSITLSGSNTPVLVATSKAEAISYSPINNGDWTPVIPDDVKQGLDILAASLGTSTADLEAIHTDTKEPTGFINRTDSTTSFDDISREFTISPVSGSFSFYLKGVKYTKNAAETITISNSDGNHYIYFDANGDLTSTQAFSIDIIEQFAFVSVIYWNTSTSSHTYFAEERHGITMDGVSHAYLHTVFGARYLSGLALQGFSVDGDGTSNTHAQFTADSGSIRDEDLLLTSSAQTQIPILYRIGQYWRKKAADAYPLIYNDGSTYTGARIPYNEYTGGAWQLTAVDNNKFVLVHLFACNDKETPIIGIQGTAQYNDVPSARVAANSEITSLSGLPFTEFVAIGTVIFQTGTFTNTPNAIVRSTNGANYVDFRGTQLYTPAGEATEHSLLSGLADDDHLQYHTDARGDARYNLKSSGDISETSFSIINNENLPSNIAGFSFSNAVVRSFEAIVSVEINATTSLFESLSIKGIKKDSDWEISVSSTGDDSGVVFSITTLGQLQYTSQNYSGFVSGVIKFKAFTTSV